MIEAINLLYIRVMDAIIEKLTLTDREIAIADGKIIEISRKRRRRKAH